MSVLREAITRDYPIQLGSTTLSCFALWPLEFV